ncbi:hypothetical protein hmeg3_14765 [Herbaspirillum sp. meg3]|uniref:hypothetical protein n=1 Tax=Herbaspirillum sp. meg3 TaxID=2025949 RepID=UPI000B993906|nr:hypothetical protein [Herbaspirillum sp. meg3]ASU39427.1 hypothetical protein hmeg3_14765 [Herbaspirillum sp. meg3]
MMEETVDKISITKESKLNILSLLSLFFVTIGSLYLFGYWSSFHVNILEYVGLSDIVKSTIIPIGTSFMAMIVGAAGGQILAIKARPSDDSDTKLSLDIRAILFIRKYSEIFSASILVGGFFLLREGPPSLWPAISLIFAVPFRFWAMAYIRSRFHCSLAQINILSVALFVLPMLPIAAYGIGRINAENILEGKKFQYVVDSSTSAPLMALRFLGHTGDFIFCWDPTKKTLLINKFDGAKSLVLKNFVSTERTETVAPENSKEK